MQVNIMIDRDNHIRVTDFGLSLVGDDTQGAPTTTRSGAHSEGWTAPELYHDNMKRRMMPRDVYAFACVCYMVSPLHASRAAVLTSLQLITGKPPYDKETRYTYFAQMVAQKKRRGSPAAVDCLGGIPASPQLWEIIQQCWRDRPHMRFTMKHILACLDMDIRFICYTGAVPFFSTRATRACK
jgi:serine/threonine protein kinase